MNVIRDLSACPAPRHGCVVTMGNYDGVHRGHRAVIAHLGERAQRLGAETALVTYEPHTLAVIAPDKLPCLLSTTDRKLGFLAAAGLDHVLVLPFDRPRAEQDAEEFVAEILAGCLHAREVVVGADARFGNKARGDLRLLEKIGPSYGFEAIHLDLVVTDGDEKISSTRVRQAIGRGDVEWAAWALERPYEVAGDVIARPVGPPRFAPGRGLCVPADGRYAGSIASGPSPGQPCAVSVRQAAPWLLDCDDDSIRPGRARVELHHRGRVSARVGPIRRSRC